MTLFKQIGDYTIRNCTKDDVIEVIRLNALLLPEHYAEKFFYELLAEFPEGFLIVEYSKEIIGYIMCRMEILPSRFKTSNIIKAGHVVSMGVSNRHRQKGLGTMLLAYALDAMREENCTECYLEVRTGNKPAIGLYKSCKFEEKQELSGYYHNGESAYVMATLL